MVTITMREGCLDFKFSLQMHGSAATCTTFPIPYDASRMLTQEVKEVLFGGAQQCHDGGL